MAGNAIDVDLTKKARNYHTHEPSASRGAVSSSCSLSTAAFDRHASGLAARSPDSLNDRVVLITIRKFRAGVERSVKFKFLLCKIVKFLLVKLKSITKRALALIVC
jgi:hypothetical protein